jgi:sugar phosphate isomerase/epimerase
MNRREFVGTAAAASALAFMGNISWAKPSQPIGVQLYTVRGPIRDDLEGTLAKVAEIGYTHVEAAGYNNGMFYGKKPAEFKALLSSMGLKMPSSHTGIGFFKNSLEQTIDDGAEAGLEYIVMPFLMPNDRKTIDDYKKVTELLNTASMKAKDSGIKIGYHNHDFEFMELEGKVPMEVMMDELDPSVIMELDLYWISKVGLDPIKFFDKYQGRVELWHVKDMDNTPEQKFAPVGTGTIDFRAIFEKDGLSGLKYFFVEQDRTDGSPIDAITTSYNNVLTL